MPAAVLRIQVLLAVHLPLAPRPAAPLPAAQAQGAQTVHPQALLAAPPQVARLPVAHLQVAQAQSSGAINLPLVVAINAGGTNSANFEGISYKADQYSTGGSAHEVTDSINA